MEEGKHKSRREDGGERKEDSKRSDRDRDRDVERKEDSRRGERERERDRDTERKEEPKRGDRDRDRGKDRERNGERHKEREKTRDRDAEKKDKESRRSERERSVDDKHKDKDRDAEKKDRDSRRSESVRSVDDKHRDKYRESRHKDRERDREKEREERDKEKEREDRSRNREDERERGKEKLKDKEKEREREEARRGMERDERMEPERERDRERERDGKEDGKGKERGEAGDQETRTREHERKRRRKDDDSKAREREQDRERERERSRSEHNREDKEDSSRKKIEEDMVTKEKRTKEEDMEEEQRKLDEEMDKRRRRVQEWQELRRKKEEHEREKLGEASTEEPESGKIWSLESDDEEPVPVAKTDKGVDQNGDSNHSNEDGDPMVIDSENGTSAPITGSHTGNANEEEEIDPLDAFMNSMVLPEVEKLNKVDTSSLVDAKPTESGKKDLKDSQINGEQQRKDEDDDEFMKRVKKTKAEKLSIVDHSKIQYPPFRKNFYIEAKEISRMTSEEAAAYRKQLELKIHGKDVPKPVKNWTQTGLSSKILDTIKKLNYEKPMPIQAQALPIIMSGRDCIGIAKTGSGKTLAFVLPMLRHIKDQPPVVPGDGPIGLIMAPTRELVQQIHSDIRKFSKALGINCVPVYGGSGVAQQISDLKRGTEIVVCTPGRMIDILCTSSGKITNLRRVTYLVMDEADRMFDMGFEPQITRIVQNTRPDRQTVLFSATFPRQVEILARKVLNKPVEIQVGGRSVVNKDITQLVEVRVLLKHGYPCLSLHGAKDQTDRESTISDFKSNVCNLLIATSVAARGLDVKELELVVNFDVPNHYEDYVHRVGRTGRAGRKGCAITFISEDDARYAPDLVKALELSEQAVPDDLKALADGFMAKVKQGTEQAHGTGYGGSGFKFNEEEDEARRAAKKAQAREYGFEEDKSDSESEDEGVRKAGGDLSQAAAIAQAAAMAAVSKVAVTSMPTPGPTAQLIANGVIPSVGLPGVPALSGTPLPVTGLTNDGAARAAALAAAMNLQHNLAKIQADAMPEHYEAEFEINDFPQNARWKVTHKDTLVPISDWTGAAITTRGQYIPPGKIPGPGERKLYLFIEGPTESSVKKAKAEVKRVLEDYTAQALQLPGAAQPGKYSVLGK
ncbi:hypothetical protein H6P81_001124 [Aristolochia fimbriata]|uniref:RNA helicase n=1 Tax=Aristolochia fimbriata TaxID=158543 RepID=A0AAV7F9V9_ARIFI|nr:hypothetical protein H6P81_001124 [Aristolochia fimbriata]